MWPDDWDWTVCVFEVLEQCKAETEKGLNQYKRKESGDGEIIKQTIYERRKEADS